MHCSFRKVGQETVCNIEIFYFLFWCLNSYLTWWIKVDCRLPVCHPVHYWNEMWLKTVKTMFKWQHGGHPKLDDTNTKKIWMFRRMISCRMIWSILVTAIRHFIFLHVCFLLLFWRECRILLIISQIFLLLNLYSMPIFHRSLFKFMGVRYCWGCYCLFWYNMVWNFLKITKLFRSDGWHPPD